MTRPKISEYPWKTTVARDLLAKIDRLRACCWRLGGLLIAAGLVVVVLNLVGCNQREIAALQETSALLRGDLVDLEAEAALSNDADLQRRVAALRRIVDQVDDRIQLLGGDTGGADLLETVGLVIAGLIPGGAIAIPFIRAARRSLDTVFASIAAGGGPKEPGKARTRLRESPRTAIAYQRWKVGRAA